MLEYSPSLQIANNILLELFQDQRLNSDKILITTYQNGREHGYKILNYGKVNVPLHIYFASALIGDLIVIYRSVSDSPIGLPAEASKTAVYIEEGDLSGVVEYIVKLIRNNRRV